MNIGENMIKSVTVEIVCCICKKTKETIKVDPIKARIMSIGTLVASQLTKKGWKALSFVAACPKCKHLHKEWNVASNQEIIKVKNKTDIEAENL
jgi:hypothetical protein